MSDWKECSCQQSPYTKLGSILPHVQPAVVSHSSPIDVFYDSSKSIIRLAAPQFINNNKIIGPLLLVGVVSATENYFRHLLSLTIQICQDTQRNCQRTIPVGTILWHQGHLSLRSLFETTSFTSLEEIKKSTKDLAGHELSKDLKAVAEEYVSVCNIRHNVVHSDRIVAGKNAVALKIPSSKKLLEFTTDYPLLQTVFEVCTSLVVAYNKELFESFCTRWAVKWCRDPSFTTKERISSFKQIWTTFHSVVDYANNSIPHPLTMLQCRKNVLNTFGSTL